jgi:FolB domain-containing protein
MNRFDTIRLSRFRFDCIIGSLQAERHVPQPVEIELSLKLPLSTAARSQRLSDTVDYARLKGEIQFVLQHSRFHLLESAAEAIAAFIVVPPLAGRAVVSSVRVALSKPQALGGDAVPIIEIERDAQDFTYQSELKPFGFVDIVYETQSVGLYRERIAPGQCVPTHLHRTLDESELTLTDGLLVQGRPAKAGEARVWPKSYVHRWDNPTSTEQAFLCIDRPKFVHADEVEVEVPVGGLQDVAVQVYS